MTEPRSNKSELKNISIIGTGLIGGSLGLALKANNPELSINGWDNRHSMKRAVDKGAIDIAASSLEDAVSDSDLVIIATPLKSIPVVLEDIRNLVKAECLVSDLGSVKTIIQAHANSVLPENVLFLGGHPMAGSEKSGVAHADSLLFENATYVLCPSREKDLDDPRIKDFISLLESTGARILVMNAEEHDRIAAAVSHIPQLLSVELVNRLKAKGVNTDLARKLAAGGFRDMTRIASSPFRIWSDILSENRTNVGEILEELIASLTDLKDTIFNSDLEKLEKKFDSASEIRRSIPKDMKGFLHPMIDVYVYAEDKPGYLSRLTTLLFEKGLNIKDLELMKIREGTGGAFKLSFSNQEEADQAISILESAEYSAFQLS